MTPYYLIACAFLDKVIPTCFFLLTAPSARTELPRSGSSRPPDRDADEGCLGGSYQSRWGPSLGIRGANHQRQILRQGGRPGNRIVVQVGFHLVLQRGVITGHFFKLVYSISHLSKDPSDLKQNGKQESIFFLRLSFIPVMLFGSFYPARPLNDWPLRQ